MILRNGLVALCAASMLAATSLAAQAADLVRLGEGPFITGGGYYIAEAKGYFKKLGIEVQPKMYIDGAMAVPSLISGELDVSFMAPNAGLFNSIAKGAPIVLILDRGNNKRGFGYTAINVTQDRIASAQGRLGMQEGFDIGLEMSGNAGALPEMLDNLTHGARVALLGLPSRPIAVDWAKVVSHMITIKGIYGREMFETWYTMTALVSTGLDVSRVITDRFPASRWQEAFAAARSGDRGKVIIDWDED